MWLMALGRTVKGQILVSFMPIQLVSSLPSWHLEVMTLTFAQF